VPSVAKTGPFDDDLVFYGGDTYFASRPFFVTVLAFQFLVLECLVGISISGTRATPLLRSRLDNPIGAGQYVGLVFFVLPKRVSSTDKYSFDLRFGGQDWFRWWPLQCKS